MSDPNRIRLGILDLGHHFWGMSAYERAAHTVVMVQRAEELGYERYWFSEHHNPSIAISAPEVILGLVAGKTSRIRIGPGGVLLRYYSPLKVTELYLTLSSAAGDRVDLGVCYGPGVTNELLALSYVSGNTLELTRESFEKKVDTLAAFVKASAGNGAVGPQPAGVTAPQLWVLGAGSRGAALAARNQACFGFQCFLKDADAYGPGVMAEYKHALRLKSGDPDCSGAIAVSIACGETESIAREMIANQVARGGSVPNVSGTPSECHRQIEDYAARYAVNTVLLASASTDAQEQLRQIELMAMAGA